MTPGYNHKVRHHRGPASVHIATDVDPPASSLRIPVPDKLMSPNIGAGDNHGSRFTVHAIQGMYYSAEQAPRRSCELPHKRRPDQRDTAAKQKSQIRLGPKTTPKYPPHTNPVLYQTACGDSTTVCGKTSSGPCRAAGV